VDGHHDDCPKESCHKGTNGKGNPWDWLVYADSTLFFDLLESGEYEKGTVIDEQHFQWGTDKRDFPVTAQNINGAPIKASMRSITTSEPIEDNAVWVLTVTDGKTVLQATTAITFRDYIYCGSGEMLEMCKDSQVGVYVKDGERLNIFVPDSMEVSRIIVDDIDATIDFDMQQGTHKAMSGVDVEGVLYTSKNDSLGNVTIKFE